MVKNIGIGTGRRKTAVARVFLREGTGKIVVNGKDVNDYFYKFLFFDTNSGCRDTYLILMVNIHMKLLYVYIYSNIFSANSL